MGNNNGRVVFEDPSEDADDSENVVNYTPTDETRQRNLEAGNELRSSGQFGGRPKTSPLSSSNGFNILERRRETGVLSQSDAIEFNSRRLPNSAAKTVDQHRGRGYCGQYSADGSLFVSASQDWRLRFYDTSAPEKPHLIQTVQAMPGRWTLTDCQLTQDKRFMIYSTMSPTVHIANLTGGRVFGEGTTIHQEALDFSEDTSDYGAFALFAIRFSGDDREIVAGAGDDSIYVYDIETKRVSFSARAHTNDVNAVAFADEKNSNLVFSGSDDAMIHVWDRRVFRSSARNTSGDATARPDGSFIGHTEGITYISGKGDGIYLLSNSKDQTLKLWDIRKLSEYRPNFTPKFRQPGWDYRMSFYPSQHPGARRQPDDTSLLTCVGHQTLQTLIRCGFSPVHSTGQRYLYCGSYDGCVYIYNLDGEIVKRLKAGESLVRDCSWHPYDQVLMATAWDGTIRMFNHDVDVAEQAEEESMDVSTPEPSEAEEDDAPDAQMQQ